MKKSQYVFITAARNGATYITKTVESLMNQIILPERWVIVSNDSTGQADVIAAKYTAKYDFIQFIKVDANSEWNFDSQIKAFPDVFMVTMSQTDTFQNKMY